MLYFAYGSNMSVARLRERVPSAISRGCHILKRHDLRFHKVSKDGSGKCDAYFTSNEGDAIYGALFEIAQTDKPALDRAEGLGHGYEEKQVTIIAADGSIKNAVTYVATNIDKSLKPYSWYVNHVFIGASETHLPEEYIQKKIKAIEVSEDPDRKRDADQRAIHSQQLTAAAQDSQRFN